MYGTFLCLTPAFIVKATNETVPFLIISAQNNGALGMGGTRETFLAR